MICRLNLRRSFLQGPRYARTLPLAAGQLAIGSHSVTLYAPTRRHPRRAERSTQRDFDMTESVVRFPPLERSAMTERQRAVADEIAAGPRGSLKGPFLVLIHNPELASCVQAVGEHLRIGTTIPKTLMEL